MEDVLRAAADGKAFAILLLVFAFLGFLLIFCAISFFFGQTFQRKISEKGFENRVKKERKAAVKMSRAVIGGQVGEQVAPFLPNFPCNPADVRFVGKPIDFVAFPGAGEGKPIREVLFIEVKTGKSELSEREKEIKKAVDSGKVRYVIWHASF